MVYLSGIDDDDIGLMMVCLGDVAVSLYDAEGRDVPIETVDNGNNTFDVAFIPESVGKIIAKVFFAESEIPHSPYVIDVQPHVPVDRISVQRPNTGYYLFVHVCLSVCVSVCVSVCLSVCLCVLA